MNDKPGMKHAPGVRCIVAVQLTSAAQHELDMANRVVSFLGQPGKLISSEQFDNGRLVVIQRQVTPMWRCAGCGTTGRDLLTEGTIMWEVTTADGGGPLQSAWVTCGGAGVFMQQHLIPLGDDSVLASDNKNRLMAPKPQKEFTR